MTEHASPSDTSTAIVSVIDNAWKNWPTTPWSRPSGRKTTTVVSVEVVTGQSSSWIASRMAAVRSGFTSRCRTIFSVMTTASSMTRPMAIAIAPSVIRLKVCPSSHITKIVMTRVSGMDDALTAVIRLWRRKRRSTMTASAAPTSMASRTALTASRTSDAWSYTSLSRTPGGSVGARARVTPATLAALASVAAEPVHRPDARNARDDRLDLVARDVVQCGRIAALDVVRQDREERWRHPLDLDGHASGQVGHDLVDARADLLERVNHLRGR